MHIEKRPVTLPQVVGWVTIVIVQAFIAGGVYISFQYRLTEMERYRVERSAQTDAKFAEIKTATDAIPNLTYRLGQSEERDKAQDARMDRIVESITNKLDVINENVNGVRTDVRVLSSRVETSLNGDAKLPSPPFKRTRFKVAPL